IEAVNLIPKAPYKLRPLDVVSITITGVLDVGNIKGEFSIQPNGTIQIIPPGSDSPLAESLHAIPAAGRTVEEVQQQILNVVAPHFKQPQVYVTLAQMAAQQQIIGEHLVAPDGKVNLGTYGRVRLVGLTIEQARAAIEAHLGQ